MTQIDREPPFGIEGLVIRGLQTLCAGSFLATIFNAEAVIREAGHFAFVTVLTSMALGLICALLAWYWRNQVTAMHRAMSCSVLVVIVGLVVLAIGLNT